MMSPRAPLTHFLAIPLYTPGAATRINTTLGRFAAEAKAHTSLSSSSSYSPSSSSTRSIAATTSDGLVSKLDAIILSGLPPPPPPPLLPRESLRPPSSIHLTLGVMSLTTPEQLEKASTYLKSLDIQQLLKSAAITADASIARFNAKAEIKARAKERAKERAKAKKKENFDSVPLEEEEIVKSSSSSTSTSISDILDDNKEEEEQERDKALDPIIVTLRGLLPMQSPDATTVLYTPPFDTTRRLQPFCEALLESFVEAGFIQPERRPLKLHASIVNTLQVKNKSSHVSLERNQGGSQEQGQGQSQEQGQGQSQEQGQGQSQGQGQRRGQEGRRGDGGRGGRNKQRLLIDATELIEKWKNEVWAEVMLEKVVICEMGAKLSEDGLMRYREIAEIPLPMEP